MNPEFFLISLIVVLIPGTGVIYTVSTGLSSGWQASIAAVIGCTAGILPHLAASIVGLSAILHMSARVFQIMKIVGSVYLLYLAWSMWRETGALSINRTSTSVSCLRIARRGFLINILNPKLTMFFFAFLPLFITHEAMSPTKQMLLLGASFMAMTFVVFAASGVLAGGVGRCLLNSPKSVSRLQRSFAVILAILAAKLALTDR